MSSFGRAQLSDIWRMLDACAPGHRVKERGHNFCVYYKDAAYPSLPTGEHGKKAGRAEIEVGKIRQMIRQLGIDLECAKQYIGVLQ